MLSATQVQLKFCLRVCPTEKPSSGGCVSDLQKVPTSNSPVSIKVEVERVHFFELLNIEPGRARSYVFFAIELVSSLALTSFSSFFAVELTLEPEKKVRPSF